MKRSKNNRGRKGKDRARRTQGGYNGNKKRARLLPSGIHPPKTDTVRFWGAPGVESPGEHLVSGDESGSFAESCLKTVADRRAKVFGCGGLLVFTL